MIYQDKEEKMIYQDDERYRQTGRTTSCMLLAMSQACAEPGREIEFVDHVPRESWDNSEHNETVLKEHIENIGLAIDVRRVKDRILLRVPVDIRRRNVKR